MDERDNPHTERFDWGKVVYWQSGRSCGKQDEWTKAELSAHDGSGGFVFERAESRDMERHIWLLNSAVKAGQRKRSRELRALLADGEGQ